MLQDYLVISKSFPVETPKTPQAIRPLGGVIAWGFFGPYGVVLGSCGTASAQMTSAVLASNESPRFPPLIPFGFFSGRRDSPVIPVLAKFRSLNRVSFQRHFAPASAFDPAQRSRHTAPAPVIPVLVQFRSLNRVSF